MASDNAAADKTCAKYLAHYAEPEVLSLTSFPQHLRFVHALVIPAFQESGDFIDRFINSILAEQKCLLIVVLNQPDNELGRQHQQAQIDLAQYIVQQGDLHWQQDSLRLINLARANSRANSAILLVDRYQQSIPPEQGLSLIHI